MRSNTRAKPRRDARRRASKKGSSAGARRVDLDDDALLDLVQRQTLRYFWDFAHPVSGLARERSNLRPEYGPEVPAFLPDEQLDLATALTAYTAGSAHVAHLDESGVIEVGRLADFAVLERDPFAGPTDDIATTRVVSTYVEGEPVYEA